MTGKQKGYIKSNNSVILKLFAAICILMVGGVFLYKLKVIPIKKHLKNGLIKITGEAECDLISDTFEWTIYFEKVGQNQVELSNENSKNKGKIRDFLIKNEIPAEEIEFFNYVKEDNSGYLNDRKEQAKKYRVGCCVYIKSKKTDLIGKLKNNLLQMFGDDIGIIKNNLHIISSKENDIKNYLHKKAIRNAMIKAENMGKDLDFEVIKRDTIEEPFFSSSSCPELLDSYYMRSAKVFDSNESSGGSEIERMKKKTMKVSVKVTFSIKESK